MNVRAFLKQATLSIEFEGALEAIQLGDQLQFTYWENKVQGHAHIQRVKPRSGCGEGWPYFPCPPFPTCPPVRLETGLLWESGQNPPHCNLGSHETVGEVQSTEFYSENRNDIFLLGQWLLHVRWKTALKLGLLEYQSASPARTKELFRMAGEWPGKSQVPDRHRVQS